MSRVRSDLSTIVKRMFVVRYRRRWGISMTRMRERAPLDVEGLRRKAAGKLALEGHPKTGQGSQKNGPKIEFRGPVFGTAWRSPFCEDSFLWSQKRDRFLGPKMGPFCGTEFVFFLRPWRFFFTPPQRAKVFLFCGSRRPPTCVAACVAGAPFW